MYNGNMNHKYSTIWLTVLSVLVLLFCFSCRPYVDPPKESPTVIPTYYIDSFCSQIDEAGNLLFSWSYVNEDFAKLSVSIFETKTDSSQSKVVLTKEIDDISEVDLSYAGEPGVLYAYSFVPFGKDGKAGKVFYGTSYAVPENYKASLPRIIISTKNGELPNCDYVTHPEGSNGAGITNNSYVMTDVSLVSPDGEVLYKSGTDNSSKLKVRGNTSAYGDKKPYKIKLGKKADLLSYLTGRTGDQFKDKEWLLLSTGTDIKNVIGFAANEYLGIEYTPAYAYVELFINGDYRGVYMLVESIKQGNISGEKQARCAVSDNGFVIENDAYWWNEDVFFRTDRLHKNFTFKYPDDEDVTDEKIAYIKGCLDAFESALLKDDDSYADYIDSGTFVSWIMVREYLGCYDAEGSNQFMIKRDSSADTKLEMTTTWDFDGIMNDAERQKISNMNRSNFFYASRLLHKSSFLELFKKKYAETKGGIVDAICGKIDALNSIAIESAGAWDSVRWSSGNASVASQKDRLVSWLNDRFVWMDSAYGGSTN